MQFNLIDPKAIDQYLEGFLPQRPEAQRILKLALAKPLARRAENLERLSELPPDAPRWLTTKWPEGGPYYRFQPTSGLSNQVQHVADWIGSALRDNDSWIRRVDTGSALMKPFRLNDIQTIEDACTEADKDMREKNRKLAATLSSTNEGETTVMDFGDGFRIVELLTCTALDRESVKMGHCIGQGEYDEYLTAGSSRLFSLRDAKNEPHATLSIDSQENTLDQCQGKENNPPVAKYLPYVAQLIKQLRCKISAHAPANRIGFVEDDHGGIHSIWNLPENLTVAGNLELSDIPITSLPRGLKVGGSLDVCNSQITALPENLSVRYTLELSGTPITALPKGLNVGGNLYLNDTRITSLPEDLQVRGALNLSNTRVTALPENLSVDGYLSLENTPITSLPKGLKVGGTLILDGTKVREIPADAEISGKVTGLFRGIAQRYLSRSDKIIRER